MLPICGLCAVKQIEPKNCARFSYFAFPATILLSAPPGIVEFFGICNFKIRVLL